MKKHVHIKSLYENKKVMKWAFFVVETLVSAFVGALIAFVFGSNYSAALISFGILMAFLIILSIVIVVLENKISLLSIMQKSIDDKRYEDAVKYGMSMSEILFSSNKNYERIMLGKKINTACENLRKQGNDNLIAGKSLDEIQAKVLIDDLGWSMHLCNQNTEAINNILQGMVIARDAAILINHQESKKELKKYISLILKGYRHLTGIYYEDPKKYDIAVYYENISKLILSTGKALKQGSPCSNDDKNHACKFPGLVCEKETNQRKKCMLESVLNIFFHEDNVGELTSIEIGKYIGNSLTGDVDLSDIYKDIELFSKLDFSDRMSLLGEQSYAWGRNIVKKLKIIKYMLGTSEYVSDYEIDCKLNEAEIYALVYYYGEELKRNYESISFGNYISLIENKDKKTTKDLRFISLLNEIEIETLSLGLSRKSGEFQDEKNQKINKTKKNLRYAAKISKIPRLDLYVRNSCHLLEMLLIEFNSLHRYMSVKECKIHVDRYLKNVESIYEDLKKYANRHNEITETYNEVKKEFLKAKSAKTKKAFVTRKRSAKVEKIITLVENINFDECNNLDEELYTSTEVEERVEKIATKWRIKK